MRTTGFIDTLYERIDLDRHGELTNRVTVDDGDRLKHSLRLGGRSGRSTPYSTKDGCHTSSVAQGLTVRCHSVTYSVVSQCIEGRQSGMPRRSPHRTHFVALILQCASICQAHSCVYVSSTLLYLCTQGAPPIYIVGSAIDLAQHYCALSNTRLPGE